MRTSVVIPCYKHDEYILEAIQSVLSQSRPVKELIVIDDGSPTPLHRPDIDDDRLIWIRTENRGLGAARNEGLRRASGEFVAFLDADDKWQTEKIAVQEDHLDANNDVAAVYCQCVQATGFFPFGPYPDPNLGSDELAALLWNGQFFPPSSVLMRRKDANAVGGFRESLTNGEDLDMWFRILTRGRIAGISKQLCWYRIHENQITANSLRKILGAKEARRGILEAHSKRLIRGGIPSDRLWDAYRNEVFCVYYRRQMVDARPMLWDYWNDHKRDIKALAYWLATYVPAPMMTALRGKI